MEEAHEVWLGYHGQQLKFQRDVSAARGFHLRSVGSKLQAGLPKTTATEPERNPDNIQL